MPSINLDILKKQQSTESHLYRDLRLDLDEAAIITNSGLFRKPTFVDIEASYDEAAIKNSLSNLFTTMPGQKLLNPEYGLNLAQFLFIPASQTMAQMIGNRLLEGIQEYEPRVSVVNINVSVDEEAAEYEIDLSLKIPKLSNTPISFTGILQQPGFSFL
tara:strand:- start:897 stop:1373 length:477 start_codon:yes stop_codon:yes gene_type:complete